MRTSAQTNQGSCQASILTEKEISSIKKKIGGVKDFKKRNQYFKVLSDPTRHKMVILLDAFGPLCVCDIGNILNVSPSAVSQHLNRLKALDLVSSQRDGKTIYYSLKGEPCCPLTQLL